MGLYYFAPGEAVQPIPWSRFGQKGFGPESVLPDRSKGGAWLGFSNGLAYFNDGEVRTFYPSADGLGAGRVNDLRFGARGSLWVATEAGLSRIRDGRVTTLTSKNGLPCDTVHWSMEDDDHFVWLYTSCGLARIAHSELDAWVSDSSRRVQPTIFDTSDGVASRGVFGGYGLRSNEASGRIIRSAAIGVRPLCLRHKLSVLISRHVKFGNCELVSDRDQMLRYRVSAKLIG